MGRKLVKEEILEMRWRCEVPDRWTGEPCGYENRGPDVFLGAGVWRVSH